MDRLSELRTVLAIVVALVVQQACGSCNLQPRAVTVTATLAGTDGLGAAVSPTVFTITNTPDAAPTPRLATASGGQQIVTNVSVEVERTGIPINESYRLLCTWREASGPSDEPVPSTAGDPTFVLRRTGRMAAVRLTPAELDSPLTASFSAFAPATLRLTGAAYLWREEPDDPSLAWTNTSLALDMSRLTAALLGVVSTRVGPALPPGVSLGGTNEDGDFRLHFIPHVTHAGLIAAGRNVKGFGFIASFRLNVLASEIGSVLVEVPIFFLVDPGVPGSYRVTIDPFDLVGSTFAPESLPFVLVRATTSGEILEGTLAATVRNSVVTAMSAPLPGTSALAGPLVASMINSVRSPGAVPANFDIVLVPRIGLDATATTEVQTLAGPVTPVDLMILE